MAYAAPPFRQVAGEGMENGKDRFPFRLADNFTDLHYSLSRVQEWGWGRGKACEIRRRR
jgi:hypothetical protein